MSRLYPKKITRGHIQTTLRDFLRGALVPYPDLPVADEYVLGLLRMIAPTTGLRDAQWRLKWRSATLRGLKEGERDHLVFVPIVEGREFLFGWMNALDDWALHDKGNWIARFSREAREVIHPILNEMRSEVFLCVRCGEKPAADVHHSAKGMPFQQIRDDYIFTADVRSAPPEVAARWFENPDRAAEFIAFHQSRAVLEPLCKPCHKFEHYGHVSGVSALA